ncbi:unnamed protein product [Larinioides sclopetarius]|uniref:Reverse transcriptase n=1 Tax=Larinioides sclopetarius TaxID=280406 RepID=A0AAV2BXU4_9ARAC
MLRLKVLKKDELLLVAEELGLETPQNPRSIELKKLIENSETFESDKEFRQSVIDGVLAEKKAKIKQEKFKLEVEKIKLEQLNMEPVLTNARKKTNTEQTSQVQQEVQEVQAVPYRCDENPHQSTDSLDLAYDYEVPWKDMPAELIEVQEENKRPTPSLRRNMVRIIKEDIGKIVQKPGRKALSIVARKIVKKYSSLSDTLCGEGVGDGHMLLSKQMEVRFANVNRAGEYNRLKRSLKEKTGREEKIKLAVVYGCLNWQPPHLPVLDV